MKQIVLRPHSANYHPSPLLLNFRLEENPKKDLLTVLGDKNTTVNNNIGGNNFVNTNIGYSDDVNINNNSNNGCELCEGTSFYDMWVVSSSNCNKGGETKKEPKQSFF